MAVTIDQMRLELDKLYGWHWKKVWHMSDSQVKAIYLSKLKDGSFDEGKPITKRRASEYHQITLTEWMAVKDAMEMEEKNEEES